MAAIQLGPEDLFEKNVKPFHIPPPIHVGLTEPERSFRKNPIVQSLVMDLEVTGFTATDLYSRFVQQIRDDSARIMHHLFLPKEALT
jgi:hypothetical protein